MKSIAGSLAALALLLVLPSAHALYKVVEPDGRVTYTDREPGPATGRVTALAPSGAPAVNAPLPAALRDVAARWPVTLFTSTDCTPCDEARRMLRERGIPHVEKTARTLDDRDAWMDTVGGPESPALKIGGQTLRGLQAERWNEYLDVAGYPRTSKLPRGYQFAEAEPVAPKRVEAARAPAPPRASAPPPSGDAPGGFRF